MSLQKLKVGGLRGASVVDKHTRGCIVAKISQYDDQKLMILQVMEDCGDRSTLAITGCEDDGGTLEAMKVEAP